MDRPTLDVQPRHWLESVPKDARVNETTDITTVLTGDNSPTVKGTPNDDNIVCNTAFDVTINGGGGDDTLNGGKAPGP
jgi:hypothetical protein